MTYYAGFDTDVYPGPAQLAWLKAPTNTNLSWCGYYLAPAPSHGDTSWMGNRQTLLNQGWGLLPIYLGQQTAGPGSHNAVPSQGSIDGAQAVQLASGDGFPAGSRVFIDWEDGSAPSADAQGYLCAWVTAVVEGGFKPGIYCSHGLAASMASLMNTLNPPPDVSIWAWKVATTSVQPYVGALTAMPAGELPVPSPAGCGYSLAVAWQCQQNCTLTLPGAPVGTMEVDLSTSNSADPSAS